MKRASEPGESPEIAAFTGENPYAGGIGGRENRN